MDSASLDITGFLNVGAVEVQSGTLSFNHGYLQTAGTTSLGGGVRSKGATNQYMMSPEDFAKEALAQLENDGDEVLVGMSVNTRREGEALFERMNSR